MAMGCWDHGEQYSCFISLYMICGILNAVYQLDGAVYQVNHRAKELRG